jgi:hypothetical protein
MTDPASRTRRTVTGRLALTAVLSTVDGDEPDNRRVEA